MTRMTRAYAVGAATAALIGGMLTVATPAHADSHTVAVTCGNGSQTDVTLTPGLVPGDTLTITYPTTGTVCRYIGVAPVGSLPGPLALSPVSGVNVGAGLTNDYVYTLVTSGAEFGTAVFSVTASITPGLFVADIGSSIALNDSYMLNQGPLPEPAVSAPTPADILQQTPVPASGSCTDVVDDAFRYGTSVSGGWSTSWASWIGSEIGGEVCTRTLTYSNSRGAWVVAS